MTAKDIISHRLSLDEAPAMFEKIATEKFFFSKIMFYPNGQEQKYDRSYFLSVSYRKGG